MMSKNIRVIKGIPMPINQLDKDGTMSEEEIQKAIEITPEDMVLSVWTYIDKIKKAFTVANNAIYFNDNSDYLTALYEICEILHPSDYKHEDGEKYIEE